MNVKKVAGIGCGGLVAIVAFVVAVGFFLPSKMELETEATLDASPESVFEHLQTLEGLRTWWGAVSEEMPDAPAMEVRHLGGPESGAGLEVGFVSGEQVFESWKVESVDAPNEVVYDVDFKIMRVERTITLTPVDGGTQIVWREVADVDNVMMRWMTFIGGDAAVGNFDSALEVLGRVSEAQ